MTKAQTSMCDRLSDKNWRLMIEKMKLGENKSVVIMVKNSSRKKNKSRRLMITTKGLVKRL